MVRNQSIPRAKRWHIHVLVKQAKSPFPFAQIPAIRVLSFFFRLFIPARRAANSGQSDSTVETADRSNFNVGIGMSAFMAFASLPLPVGSNGKLIAYAE